MPERGAITVVGRADFGDLLPLVRAYCDFYEVAPSDAALIELFEALYEDPAREGVQLIARGPREEPLGFATLYWTWSTTHAARLAVMNDLFVVPEARGSGLAEQLIDACREQSRARGATTLSWQTAPDNRRAQRLYERIGAVREQWVDYSLPVTEDRYQRGQTR
jgi:ribosomal protein S18 acetylase RimI-like enzyme